MKSQLDLMIKGQGPVAQALALALGGLHYKVGLSAPNLQLQTGETNQAILSNSVDPRHYALSPRSKAFLQKIHAWPSESSCTPVLAMHIHCDSGEVVHLTAKNAHPLAHVVSANALNSQLQESLQNEAWVDYQKLDPVPNLALTLICEGRLSHARDHLGVQYEHVPYEQQALSGNVRARQSHQQIAHQWFLNVSQHGSEILALLPNGGAHSNSYSFVWSQPASLAQSRKHMNPAQLQQELERTIHSQLGPLECLDTPQTWALSKSQALQWVGQRSDGTSWCLLGDAAHSVHPLAGMGLNLGLDDAMEITRLLQDKQTKGSNPSLSDLHLLRRFERTRKAQMLPTWITMDAIQRLFAHTNPMVQSLRNWGASRFERTAILKDFVVQQASSLHL